MASGTTHRSTQRYVLLTRVSTTKQGADGNGISAQRRDIQLFLDQQENPEVVAEFVEVESGAKQERPVLEQAIKACQKHKATLLCQKVCRLTRDVETLGRLTKLKNVQIRIASLPSADNFQIHLYGILASQERQFIAERTVKAMAEAKKRGVKFGNPRLAELNKTRKREARIYAYEHAELVKNLRNDGKTYRQICDFLNSSNIKTRNGGRFYPVQVHRILKRTEEGQVGV